MAGRALRRAAELGDGWFGGTNYQLSRQIVPAVHRYHRALRRRRPAPGPVLVNRLAVVVEREAEVEAAAGPALDLLRLYTRLGAARHPDGTPVTADDIGLGSPIVGELAIIGTVEQAREQLAGLRGGRRHPAPAPDPAGRRARRRRPPHPRPAGARSWRRVTQLGRRGPVG